MARYRIHRLKDHLRQQFRYAPHVSGESIVKPRDYREEEEFIDADSPYAAFFSMKDSTCPLQLGDLLEAEGGLQIFKFVGFEQAAWMDVAVQASASTSAGEIPDDEANGQRTIPASKDPGVQSAPTPGMSALQ